MTTLVDEAKKIDVEQRAQRDVDADLSQVRDELRDAEAASGAFFRNR